MSLPQRASPPRPTQLLLPPALVLVLAVTLSVGLHMQAYVGLGFLKLFETHPPPSQPMEVEIVESNPTEPTEAHEEAEPAREIDEPAPPEPEHHARQRGEEEARPPVPPRPEPEEQHDPQIALTPPAPPPPPREQRNLTSVEHHSRDPNVEPPPDAQHLAAENSRVEEETMARIRNPNLDDPEPQPAPASEETPAAEEEGDAAEEEMAHLQDAEGSHERDPTPEEARLRPREHPPDPSTSRNPAMSEAARGEQGGGGSEGTSRPRDAAGGGRRARGGGEERVAMHDVIVSDGLGTFTIRVPDERPAGSGAGDGGGVAVAGRGRGNEGDGMSSGRAGRAHRRARGGTARGRGSPSLRVSWSQFSSIYGEEELQQQREAYLEQRRSHTRGMSRQERWDRFRAAIENYDVRVRPGNQTALNTRADPFAAYIAAMHRRIHPRFAGGYLLNVPSIVDETFRTNQDMHTNLELAIDAEGRVAHVSVVGTSGDTLFDLGAFDAVMGAQPFPAPPSSIASPDGLTYMHWSFYRNQRQCGTFNAEAYILAHAPTPRGGGTGDPILDRGTVFHAPESGAPPPAAGSRDISDGPDDGPSDSPHDRRAPSSASVPPAPETEPTPG